MLLKFARAQFARRDRRSVTHVTLNRSIRPGRWRNCEEWVVEQKQRQHQTNRTPKKAHSLVSRRFAEFAHSLHIIIDAPGADFASRVGRQFLTPVLSQDISYTRRMSWQVRFGLNLRGERFVTTCRSNRHRPYARARHRCAPSSHDLTLSLSANPCLPITYGPLALSTYPRPSVTLL